MKQFIDFFIFYYRVVGKKVYAIFFLGFFGVIFEGLGITMFLPLLGGSGEGGDSKLTEYLATVFKGFGLNFNLKTQLSFLVIFLGLRACFLIWQTVYTSKVALDLLMKIRKDLCQKFFEANFLVTSKMASGYFSNVLDTHTERVTFAFQRCIDVLIGLLFVVFYFVFPITQRPVVLILLCALALPLMFFVKKINKKTKINSIEMTDSLAGFTKILIQSVLNLKYLKGTATYPKVLNKTESHIEKCNFLQKKSNWYNAINLYAFEPFALLLVAVYIYIEVVHNHRPLAENIFFLFLVFQGIKKILSLQNSSRKVLENIGSIQVVDQLKRSLTDGAEYWPNQFNDISLTFKIDGSVKFDSVCFSYVQGGESGYAVNHASVSLEPKSMVGIVGSSGSGKTTFVNLLLMLFRPNSGKIIINGIDSKSIDPRLIQSKIGYITQENVIFNDSLKNNIILWDENVDRLKLNKVIELSQLKEFVSELKNGVDSWLDERGTNLSGGQRQRISIARELYKDTDILVFDEATNSLDIQTEKEIQKNIEALKGIKTVVIISHNIKILKSADKILVFEKGVVVQEGTFLGLSSCLDGPFKKIIGEH